MVISFAKPVEPDSLATEIRGDQATDFQVVARKFVSPVVKPVTACEPDPEDSDLEKLGVYGCPLQYVPISEIIQSDLL